jgi:L-ascorbate metabolism protein UlaG (beta-lactamase superfamily)
VVLETGGLRLVTDPKFDSPRSYEPRPGVKLTRTNGPALLPADIGPVDVVLGSLDQHKDNLDHAGRSFLAEVPRVLPTVSGAERLGNAGTALPNWESVDVARPDAATLRITGVPAQHGPDGSEHLTGRSPAFCSPKMSCRRSMSAAITPHSTTSATSWSVIIAGVIALRITTTR